MHLVWISRIVAIICPVLERDCHQVQPARGNLQGLGAGESCQGSSILFTFSSPQLQVGTDPDVAPHEGERTCHQPLFLPAPWKLQDVGSFACWQWMLLQCKALSASTAPSHFRYKQRRDDPGTCGLVSWEKGSEVRGPCLEIRCPAGDSVALPLLMHQSITCPVQTSCTSISNN